MGFFKKLFGPSALEMFTKAKAHYERGEYAAAFPLFLESAEGCIMASQF